MLTAIQKELAAQANPKRAEQSVHYFSAGAQLPGTIDYYRGVPVPEIRRIARENRELKITDLRKLANSTFHDERLCALFILNHRYEKAITDAQRIELFEFWLKLLKSNKLNNWDLIDTSAPVMGRILSLHLGYGAKFLHSLAKSQVLWERRAAILLTFALIRMNKFGPTIAIAKDLLNDKEDLIHKAVGWMLREVGKRDLELLNDFLHKYSKRMPRTMLRYAIEKHGAKDRAKFMAR